MMMMMMMMMMMLTTTLEMIFYEVLIYFLWRKMYVSNSVVQYSQLLVLMRVMKFSFINL